MKLPSTGPHLPAPAQSFSPPLPPNFKDCCRLILSSRKASPEAKAYALAGLRFQDNLAIRIQAQYILANIQCWREPQAKLVRQALRQCIKELS